MRETICKFWKITLIKDPLYAEKEYGFFITKNEISSKNMKITLNLEKNKKVWITRSKSAFSKKLKTNKEGKLLM